MMWRPKRKKAVEQDLEITLSKLISCNEHEKCYLKFIDTYIGSGVFAARTLTKGEFLLEYKGDFIEGNDDVDTGFKFYFKHNEKMLCIDATNAEGLGRMVNDHPGHKANCRMRKILLSGGKPRLCLFAVKDISEGEELRFDYGVSNLPWRKEKRGAVKQVLYNLPSIFGVPWHVCAEQYGRGVERFEEDSQGMVQEVHFVDINSDILKEIQSVFSHMFKVLASNED